MLEFTMSYADLVGGAGPRGEGAGLNGGSKGRGCGFIKHMLEEGDDCDNVKTTVSKCW